jgi:4-alpha-glucanotransferase
VPADSPTARTGQWVSGPGAKFFYEVKKQLGVLPFIAEDLGIITSDVCALRDEFHFPGTRVLQFAFDGNPENPHLPANYSSNTVVYTGTHDNNTVRGWFESLSELERERVRGQLNRPNVKSENSAEELVQTAWRSPAALAIAPLQDLLNLGSQARMNLPGSSTGNWSWRAPQDLLNASVLERLRDLTATSRRAGKCQPLSALRADATRS